MMEIDDLKNTWEDLNCQVNKGKDLNPEFVEQLTKAGYHRGLKKIIYPEVVGAIICLLGAAFIGFNFNKLDTIFFQGTGIVSLLVLFTLSAISLISIRQLNTTGDVTIAYAETLKIFSMKKMQFLKFQRINITLSYLLLVTIIILLPKFFGGKDLITGNKFLWTFSFSMGYIFLLFFSKWVFKSYNRTLLQAEELLKELAS